MTKLVLAFAGNGDTTKKNTFDLLNDFVGDRDVKIVFPVATESRFNGGMETVLDWVEELDLPFTTIYDKVFDDEPSKDKTAEWLIKEAESASATSNVNTALLKYLDEYADAHLVLLWGENASPYLHDLLEEALDRKFHVIDLTDGLDDIRFEDEEEPEATEPDPEEEPEPEEKAPAKAIKPKAKEIEPPVEEPAAEIGLVAAIEHLKKATQILEKALSEAQPSNVWEDAPEPSEVSPKGGRPRKDGQPAKPRTAREKAVMEIFDEETGEWRRKSRGRAPKGAKTRYVDPTTGDVVAGPED